jgi:hypothetical protein
MPDPVARSIVRSTGRTACHGRRNSFAVASEGAYRATRPAKPNDVTFMV